MDLSDEQLKRYSRNIAIDEIGKEGQEILLQAKVLVVGAGGLGSPLLSYLTAAGIGEIGIIDSDRIELSNLQRQILYSQESVGKSKVEQAKARLEKLNPEVKINAYRTKLDASNAAEIIGQYDIVADGCDNFPTRFLVSDTCHALGKPLVSSAIQSLTGQISTFKSYLGKPHPCYRCFCPSAPSGEQPTCSNGGILGSVAGIMGSLQATEIIKEILEIGESLSGSILIYDALKSHIRKVGLSRNKSCTTCSEEEICNVINA